MGRSFVNWANPYQGSKGIWLKGNLHTHVGEGMSLQDALDRYAELGYDFVCISDHMKLTEARHSRVLTIPGVEWNSRTGEHMTVCSLQPEIVRRCLRNRADQFKLLRALAKEPALVVLNHPNWREPPHYSREDLLARSSASGVEIYNGLIERSTGTALATEKWDFLLSSGRRLLGFGSDDAHRLDDIGNGWIVVRAAARTRQAVFDAIRRGRFYCSSGVTICEVRKRGTRIVVETKDADEIWAIGEGGMRLARARGRRMEFDSAGIRTPYVRFVAYGRGAAMAWTQPFFAGPAVDPARLSPFVMDWSASSLVPGDLGATRAVASADPLGWRPVRAMDAPRGFVNVHALTGNRDGVLYLAARVEASGAADWIVALGHDGGARLYVDGRRVINQPLRVNPAFPDRSQARVRLSRGAHEFVVALHTDRGLGQGIFLRFIRPKSAAGRAAFPGQA